MIVPLLAGAAKPLVVSMLSERVVLRVLVMLSEWAAAKSTNSLDDRLVIEMKTKPLHTRPVSPPPPKPSGMMNKRQ